MPRSGDIVLTQEDWADNNTCQKCGCDFWVNKVDAITPGPVNVIAGIGTACDSRFEQARS